MCTDSGISGSEFSLVDLCSRPAFPLYRFRQRDHNMSLDEFLFQREFTLSHSKHESYVYVVHPHSWARKGHPAALIRTASASLPKTTRHGQILLANKSQLYFCVRLCICVKRVFCDFIIGLFSACNLVWGDKIFSGFISR